MVPYRLNHGLSHGLNHGLNHGLKLGPASPKWGSLFCFLQHPTLLCTSSLLRGGQHLKCILQPLKFLGQPWFNQPTQYPFSGALWTSSYFPLLNATIQAVPLASRSFLHCHDIFSTFFLALNSFPVTICIWINLRREHLSYFVCLLLIPFVRVLYWHWAPP